MSALGVGKGGHVRTVPVPTWVKAAVDNWLIAAGISAGPTFRAIYKASRIATSGFSSKVIWGVVQAECSKCGLDGVAPHDLRRYAESRIMPNRQLCGHASKGLDTARYGIVLTMPLLRVGRTTRSDWTARFQ